MLGDSVHGFRVELSFGFVYQARDFDGVDADHGGLGALEVDSHELLPSLLLEMCPGVGKRLLDDCGLHVHESFLKYWSADETEVLRTSDEDLKSEDFQ